jgi:hypothetical protein
MRRVSLSLLVLVVTITLSATSVGGKEPARIYVVLWWDTEDYVLPASDDAALRLARWLTQQGIRATFKVVGEKARTLEKRQRTDVIAALKRHEIGYHSNYHSVQPTPAMYLSQLGWDEGVSEFERRERHGLDDVKRIFGQHPSCYGQPGSSWGPQSFGALKRWKIPVYLDAGNHIDLDGKPLYYCGIAVFYRLTHTLRTNLGGPDDLKVAEERFINARRQLLQEGGGIVSIYYHPCEFVHREFWDGVNFARGANPPLDQLRLPPRKTEAESATAYETFESFINFIKRFPEVQFVTASELATIYRDTAHGRVFSHEEIQRIAGHVSQAVTFQVHADYSLAASEILWLLASMMHDRLEGKELKDGVRLVETPLGPTAPPLPMRDRVVCSWSQFRRSLADLLDFMNQHGRVPSTVWLGSEPITPEAFLVGVAREYQRRISDSSPIENIEFRPAILETGKYVAEDAPRLWGWIIFPPGFRAPKMMELARWQAWTIKPAIHHGLHSKP